MHFTGVIFKGCGVHGSCRGVVVNIRLDFRRRLCERQSASISSKMLASLVVAHCAALAAAIYRVVFLPLIKYSSESVRAQMRGAI